MHLDSPLDLDCENRENKTSILTIEIPKISIISIEIPIISILSIVESIMETYVLDPCPSLWDCTNSSVQGWLTSSVTHRSS